MSEFQEELQRLLNRHNVENDSGTPDFILALFLKNCLYSFAVATNDREKWYGREQDDQFRMPLKPERQNMFTGVMNIKELLHQAVGAGSMCWENVSGAGVFDDGKARQVAEDLEEQLSEIGY